MTDGSIAHPACWGFLSKTALLQLCGVLLISILGGLASNTARSAETILETGGGIALQRVSVPVVAPTNYPSASVRFDVSFVTNERLLPGEFLDSFTLSLRNTNRTIVAAVLTVDRFGIIWAPVTPGGFSIAAEDLAFEPAPSPPDSSNFLFQASYRVLVNLPPALLRQPAALVLSLFDNDDSEASRAIVSDVRVRLGLTSPLALESSAIASGPYGRESGAAVNRLRQTLTVPRAGGQRFFRLRGETNSSIARLTRIGQDIELRYEAALGQLNLVLEGANEPPGPFAPVLNAQFDLNAHKVFVPLLNAPGFFRIGGSHPARIINDEVIGNQRVLEFEVHPKPPVIESAAQVNGPFAEESGVTVDPFAQLLQLPRGGVARFYRVSGELPLVLQGISVAGEKIIVSYEEP
jgi:hypothetical protein